MSHIIYEPVKQRLQRSELAVPGSSPKMFEKALKSTADYVFLDLEDAVAPDDKLPARQNVIDAINDLDWKGNGKTISVRINSIDTHYMSRDVVEVVEQVAGLILSYFQKLELRLMCICYQQCLIKLKRQKALKIELE